MMAPKTKLKLVALMVVALVTVLIGSFHANANRNVKASHQDQERVVVDKSISDAPVKITLIKTKKRAIEDNKKFTDDDDWLQGLTLRVNNRSDKIVTYVGVHLGFDRTADQESGLPAGWPLDHGFDPFRLDPEDAIPAPTIVPIASGSDAEIILTDNDYAELRKSLAEIGFPASRKRVSLDVDVVGFSDGTAWNMGHLFRRDSNYLQGPLKGWRPLDDPLGQKWRPRNYRSSAVTRHCFFH